MASSVSTEYIGSRLVIKSYDHDPDSTSATFASPDAGTTIRYYDMKDFEKFGVIVKPNIIGGSGITKVEIYASATTTFSSATNIKDSGTVAASTLDKTVFLECSAEEIAQLGSTLRYVAAKITTATNTDEATVTYIGVPRREYTGLTASGLTTN